MALSERYTVARPHEVILEEFDDEVVIVDLKSGNYYSLVQSGAAVWSLLHGGACAQQIVDEVARRYRGERAAIEAGIADLLTQLQSEALIEPASNGSAAAAMSDNGAQPVNGSQALGQEAFVAPKLQKYTDMTALLLLDPIHGVDDMGWPSEKQF